MDEGSFETIPSPAAPGAGCQTCDYWERLNGRRDQPEGSAARELKRARLLAGARLAGAYGMLAWRPNPGGDPVAAGWAQFGPISAYPRAQVIRDRYASLPDSPAPWVITCLQVVPAPDRDEVAGALVTGEPSHGCTKMMELAGPLEARAGDAFAVCLEKSTELGWFNTSSVLCERALSAMKPEQFPRARELRAEPLAVAPVIATEALPP